MFDRCSFRWRLKLAWLALTADGVEFRDVERLP